MIPDMDAWCRARCAPLVVPSAAQVTTRLHHFPLVSLQKRLSSREKCTKSSSKTTKSNTRNILLGCWDAGKQIDGNDLRQWVEGELRDRTPGADGKEFPHASRIGTNEREIVALTHGNTTHTYT